MQSFIAICVQDKVVKKNKFFSSFNCDINLLCRVDLPLGASSTHLGLFIFFIFLFLLDS